MLKVKLARFGKKNQPHYRIVVNEARDKRDGSYVALVGHYAPTQIPKTLEINMEEYQKWISQGAQPTDTVAALVRRYQSGNPFPEKKAQLSKKAKAKIAAQKEAKESAKVEEITEVKTEIPVKEAPKEAAKN